MKKIVGFKLITAEGFQKAFDYMAAEGTCCLSYGDWTALGENLLLTEEQQAMRKAGYNTDEADHAWGELDVEICEAMIMLPVLRNTCTTSLYWCSSCGIVSTTDFFCKKDHQHVCKFGVDFGEEQARAYEL